MDGGGIAQTGRGLDIAGWQPDGQVASVVSHGQVTLFGDEGDGRPVFHPVGRGEAEAAVVAAGDDHISDAGPVPVGQRHLDCGSEVIETMRPGTAVEFGDQLPGGGDHDRVKPRRAIGNPSAERILGGLLATFPMRGRR